MRFWAAWMGLSRQAYDNNDGNIEFQPHIFPITNLGRSLTIQYKRISIMAIAQQFWTVMNSIQSTVQNCFKMERKRNKRLPSLLSFAQRCLSWIWSKYFPNHQSMQSTEGILVYSSKETKPSKQTKTPNLFDNWTEWWKGPRNSNPTIHVGFSESS